MVSAGIYHDGRRRFDTWGEPLTFEETSAYSARLKRERLTRPMLIRHLAELGIRADDEDAYGDVGTLPEDQAIYERRTTSVERFRAEDHSPGRWRG